MNGSEAEGIILHEIEGHLGIHRLQIYGGNSMVFEIKYWKDRLQAVKTQKDFAQLLKELPEHSITLDARHKAITKICNHLPLLFALNT